MPLRVGASIPLHLLLRETDFQRIPPPTPPSVDEESSGYDRRFERKLTQVCSTPAPLSLVNGAHHAKPIRSAKYRSRYCQGRDRGGLFGRKLPGARGR